MAGRRVSRVLVSKVLVEDMRSEMARGSWSQAELADRAGVSRQYVHKVLRRTSTGTSVELLGAVLGVLGLDVDRYVGDPGPEPWVLPPLFDAVAVEDRRVVERGLAVLLRAGGRLPG